MSRIDYHVLDPRVIDPKKARPGALARKCQELQCLIIYISTVFEKQEKEFLRRFLHRFPVDALYVTVIGLGDELALELSCENRFGKGKSYFGAHLKVDETSIDHLSRCLEDIGSHEEWTIGGLNREREDQKLLRLAGFCVDAQFDEMHLEWLEYSIAPNLDTNELSVVTRKVHLFDEIIKSFDSYVGSLVRR